MAPTLPYSTRIIVLEFLRQWSNVIMIALNAGVTCVLWSLRQTFATKGDIAAVVERVSKLEAARKGAPTRRDLNQLTLEMERVRGDMRAFGAQMEAQREQFGTEVSGARELFSSEIRGVRDLVVRTERMIGFLNQHHIENP